MTTVTEVYVEYAGFSIGSNGNRKVTPAANDYATARKYLDEYIAELYEDGPFAVLSRTVIHTKETWH